MATTYKTRYGYDWPLEMPDIFIGLVIGKKWREFKAECGFEFKDPWEPYLESLRALFGDKFKTPEWTVQHVHDWVMEPFLLTWGCGACGKGFLRNEPVFVPNGKTTVGELSIGDKVIAATGNPATVVGVYDHTDLPLYRVTFEDGTEEICDENHLWTVRYWGRKEWVGPRKTRKAVSGWLEETMPVTRLASWSARQVRRRLVAVPASGVVEFDKKDVPIDPYVLGCLLGDGSVCDPVLLTSADEDIEVRDEFVRRLHVKFPEFDLKKVNGHKYAYVVSKNDRTGSRLLKALSEIGIRGCISEKKFIPDSYLYNSSDVRIDVLAGLMDTDGTVDKRGRISYCTVSPMLRDGVRFLAESIGANVSVYERHPRYRNADGTLLEGRTAYEVVVTGLPLDLARRTFKLSRKRDRVRVPVKKRTRVRRIVSVEKITNRDDYPRETRCITIAKTDDCGNKTNGLFLVGDHFTVTHNSNDTGALLVTDWIVDPYDTTTLVGSTTKDALRIRTWESVERYFALLQANREFAIPGKITQTGYSILNDREGDNDPLAQGAKAGIHGVALNDGGKLQGAHSKYVRLIVDELATINNHDGKGGILETIDNLQIAPDFKFAALANPEGWPDPSSQYAIPEGGIDSVTVDTGCWRSTFGCFVRHHDGLKAPTVLDESKAAEFPYLIRKKHIEDALKRSNNNPDSPRFWKMVRGFPIPVSTGSPPVLDMAIATQQHVADPVTFEPDTLIATVGGCDPAWTENGDGACYARAFIRRDQFGRPYLDFTNGLTKFEIKTALLQTTPAVQQLANQIVQVMRLPYSAPFRHLAIDASANQGLADHLKIFYGADSLPVNNSVRASDEPIRANETEKVSDTIYDRGTEAWCVLAEFCRAGMVRGLPAEALRALTTRRFAVKKNSSSQLFPLRLESKDDFNTRFKKSPDECDACALAALAAKERFGLMPFGYMLQTPSPESMFPQQDQQMGPSVNVRDFDDYGADALDGDDFSNEPI